MLVIDDDPLHLQALVRCLEEDHLRVISAESPAIVLEYVDRIVNDERDIHEDGEQQDSIDVAIVDVRLGDMGRLKMPAREHF